MPDLKCDPKVLCFFGPQGFEALVKVTLKNINKLLVEQEKPELTYEQFRDEIETELESIVKST